MRVSVSTLRSTYTQTQKVRLAILPQNQSRSRLSFARNVAQSLYSRAGTFLIVREKGVRYLFLAEQFLPQFNKRFSVEPRSQENLHRVLAREERAQLDATLSRQEERVIQNDFTLSFKKQWYQLQSKQPVLVRKKERVIVEERTDGAVYIRLRGKYLAYTIVPKRQEKRSVSWILSQQPKQQKRIYAKPAADHPCRRPFLPARSTIQMTHESSSGSNVAHSAS